MLQLVSVSVRDALDRAAHARMKARFAADEDSRRFWDDMTGKWCRLAEARGFVERVNAALASAGATRSASDNGSTTTPNLPSAADCWAAAAVVPINDAEPVE